MDKNTNIYLVGLMGAGKTTVGRQLARRLGRRFYDSDHEIEARTGAGYDDGYLGVSTYATIRPGGWSTGIHLTLKGPDGEIAF